MIENIWKMEERKTVTRNFGTVGGEQGNEILTPRVLAMTV